MFSQRFAVGTTIARRVHSPTAIFAIQHRQDPQEWPQDMQRKQTYPAGNVQHVLVWMIAFDRDLVRDIVDGDDAVEHH